MIRPRISDDLAVALTLASGLAKLRVSQYLDRVVLPLVEADAAERLSRSKYAASEDGSSEDK
jgi:hypothetical protein|tara:strand:- start:432 stop:617 length:186 start_codon:yes stop_codon:yes gene_type:complete